MLSIIYGTVIMLKIFFGYIIMLSVVMLRVIMLSVVMLSVFYDECCGSVKMSPSFFNLNLEYLHEVKSLPESKRIKFCLPLFTHCPNKLVRFSSLLNFYDLKCLIGAEAQAYYTQECISLGRRE
jgi:hypothetical protein